MNRTDGGFPGRRAWNEVAAMWFFKTPEIVFGEDALSYLEQLEGRRAFVITDPGVRRLGLVKPVEDRLRRAGLAVHVFDAIQPNPSIHLVRIGADVIRAFNPDWIVAVGGGSVIDAAKAIWVLFERPDLDRWPSARWSPWACGAAPA